MTSRIHTIRQAILPLLVLVGAACAPSEGSVDDVGARGAAAEAAVYSVFPEVQPRWIEWPYRFEARRGSTGKPVFATPLSDLPKSIFVEVPIAPGEPVVVHGKDGFAMRVWDNARRGAAELTASGLTYGRTGGGTSFWTARESGAEEWLYLPEGASQLEVARYRIGGGRPQQHEWAIDIYDENDKPRVTMTAPQVFATGGQRVDAKMVLQGDEAVVVLTEWVEGPLLVDPAFVQAGDMSGDRKWHDALLLPSGRVMVLGGYKQIGFSTTDLATMELFDSATGTWSNGPSAASPRLEPTLTTLDDGRVLVVSQTTSGPQPWTEIYDEQTNAWWTPAQPVYQRYYHQAVRLEDGRVLVAGGSPNGNKVEIYDVLANAWTSVAAMNKIYTNKALVLLANGDPVIVGGSTTEVYSLASDTWTFRAAPIYKSTYEGIVALPGGDVVTTGGTLVASGNVWGHGTQRYDIAADSWTQLAATATPRDNVQVTLMNDGSLFLSGGYNSISGFLYATSEVYSFANDAWTPGPSLVKARAGHSQTRLPDGRVLVAGGYDTVAMVSLQSTEVLTATQPAGSACSTGLDCVSFFCVDGLCCDNACSGACTACSIAAGGTQDGTCTVASSVACDDGDACTLSDTCTSGVCSGTAKVCPGSPGECFGPDVCDSTTGNCVSQALADGTPCSLGSCSGGACIGSGTGGGGTGGTGGVGGSSSQSTGGSGGMGAGGGSETSTGGGGTGGQPSGQGGAGGVSTVGVGTSSASVGGDSEPSSASSGGVASGVVPGGGCGCRVGGTEEVPSHPGEILLFLAALLPLRQKSSVQC